MQKINTCHGVNETSKTEEEIEEEQLTNFAEALNELYCALKRKGMLPESFVKYQESLQSDVGRGTN